MRTILHPEEIRFLAVNDLHFAGEDCGEWLEVLVRRINAHPERPEFCLVLGDLVEDGTAEQLSIVRQALQRLSMPWQVVPGNHDGDRSTWETLFPASRNRAFEHAGTRFIGLDTTAGTAYENTCIPEETLAWLRGHLAEVDPEQPLLLFTHFPLGEGVRYRPVNADELLDLTIAHNLRGVLSGHFHAATEVRWREAALITGRCCSPTRENHDGSTDKGYQLCRLWEGRLEREFVPVEFR